MRRIFSQARKELTQLVRDRLALALALVLPLILLFLLSTAIALTVHNLPLVIQDLDDSSASRRFADAFPLVHFLPRGFLAAGPQAGGCPHRQPRARRADRSRNFGRDLARGANVQVQLLVDATDSNTARIVQGYVNQITNAFNQDSGAMAGATLVGAQVRLWYNPGRDSPKFYSPGIFVMGISMFPALLAALAMAKEGEQKTILQVYVSSISAHEFLLGKILAFMVMAACEWVLGMIAC
jgi:ABC-2 type transport system permease protein